MVKALEMTISRQRLARLEAKARCEAQRFFTYFTDNKTYILNGKEYTDEATMIKENRIGDGDTVFKVVAPLRGLFARREG